MSVVCLGVHSLTNNIIVVQILVGVGLMDSQFPGQYIITLCVTLIKHAVGNAACLLV